MKIVVLGAGAVGLTVAAKLSRIADVHAVARTRHADAVRERGFLMTGIWGEGTYRFSCSEDLPGAWRDADYYIVAAKSTDTEAICRQFADAIGGREVISLQNGIGNEEIIARFTDRVVGAMIITGFEWRGDASVHVSVEAAPMKIGRFPSGTDDAVEDLAALIRDAGIRAEATDSIRTDIWGKTLYNCALNPLGALMNVPYGALVDPHAWAVVAAIVEEAYRVAKVEGVPLPWETAEAYLEYLRTTQLPATAAHHSSMLQDIAGGRKTEIDFMNGAVAALAEKHGVGAPYNTCIAELIRFRERL
ncbi:2-dehydropantoate 2-reductase [Methanoculleus sediminis]|uniref:2-dehydropantoate 2-reductase n=1 Tax=Methanoculleus sediminis TaxID=1550566 RepID=A0A0H1QWP0_9EURY|nr:ketopantoate reductase family protein [Methanoculleus sediminis]KLK87328.1 2-dehydropantoate 2-reductase [Methanoculleus sediminis]